MPALDLLRRLLQRPRPSSEAGRGGEGAARHLARRVLRVARALARSRDQGAAQLAARAGLVLERSSGVQVRAGEARFTNADPQLVFAVPAMDAAAAWFRVELDVLSLSGPQIFLDYGRGFHESTSVALREDEASLSALLISPASIRRLRFDPSRRAGGCSIQGFSLTPIFAAGAEGGGEVGVVASALAAAAALATHPARSGEFAAALHRANAAVNRENARGGLDAYARWRSRHEPRGAEAVSAWMDGLAALSIRPLISVVVPIYETPEAHLRAMVESVREQAYPDWELCLADDASRSPHVRAVIEDAVAFDPRIRAVFRSQNGHICTASNSALELATGEWTVLLDHDDLLTPDALLEVVRQVEAHPQAVFVYSDEDKLDEEGRRYDAFFKPDYSPELLRSQNYLNHLTAIRTDLIRSVGGWRAGFEGSQDHDLYLRVLERARPEQVRHIPKVLYHWRAVAGSTALSQDGKDYAFEAGQRAVREHVARTGLPVERVERVGRHPFHRIVYALPELPPLVTLIVPTRDRADLLDMSVRSILKNTDYSPYEVLIVDNDSVEPGTHALLSDLVRDDRVRVLRHPGAFNYSALNNAAARQARGSIFGLVNNDIEVITPGWLREMVSWTTQPRIGCVGAKLYYPDGTIQHAGVVLGLGGVAGHGHKRRGRDDPGYFGRIAISHEVSAVTGACLLVRKAVWDEVGGLNERLQVAFNDVDFCLRVREAGYANVFTPFAELYHHESLSRGEDLHPVGRARFASEVEYMLRCWTKELERDPFYSPSLSLAHNDYDFI